MKCKHMGDSGICYILSTADHFEHCIQGPCPHEAPMTNADRIRAMSDEELAESRVIKINGIAPCPLWVAMDDVTQTQYLSKSTAVKVELDWLAQSAEEG